MVIVIGLCLCLWLARSGGLAARVVTIVVLSVAVVLAGSCVVRVFDPSYFLWCYYLLTSGLFTIGWLVMMVTVSGSAAFQNSGGDVRGSHE